MNHAELREALADADQRAAEERIKVRAFEVMYAEVCEARKKDSETIAALIAALVATTKLITEGGFTNGMTEEYFDSVYSQARAALAKVRP